jgi:hypothetical protein
MIAAHLTAALDKRLTAPFGGGSRYARLRALPPMNVSSASTVLPAPPIGSIFNTRIASRSR